MEGLQPRTIICSKCGKKETEKVFGTGFPGWNRIAEIVDEKGLNPELCPECMKELCQWFDIKKEGVK